MNRSARSLSFLAFAALFISVEAHAAGANFDFENLSIGTETPFSVTSGGITAAFDGPASVDPGAFGISSNYPSPTGFQYRLLSGDFLTVGSAFGATGSALTIRFDKPITAFSFDFGLDDPGHTSALAFSTSAGGSGSSAGTLSAGFIYPEGSVSFSGTPFDILVLRSSALDFQLDNLAVVAAVPEPTTLGLLAGGLGVLAAYARRKR